MGDRGYPSLGGLEAEAAEGARWGSKQIKAAEEINKGGVGCSTPLDDLSRYATADGPGKRTEDVAFPINARI